MRAAFSEFEGDASGAVGWLPLSTVATVRPPMTAAASAIGGTAPFSFSYLELGIPTDARLTVTRAHIAALPIILSRASVHGLGVLREVED